MAGYNPNYFNRNLIESMKQTIIKSIVNEGEKTDQDSPGRWVVTWPTALIRKPGSPSETRQEITFGITPGETPRQREMADPNLQRYIDPIRADISNTPDPEGDWDKINRLLTQTTATPPGKELEPQDIRPEPTTPIPTPQRASGASIQSVTPGQIPSNVLRALRRPMGPYGLKN